MKEFLNLLAAIDKDYVIFVTSGFIIIWVIKWAFSHQIKLMNSKEEEIKRISAERDFFKEIAFMKLMKSEELSNPDMVKKLMLELEKDKEDTK